MEQRIGGYPFELSGDTSAELYDFADGQYLRSLCSVFSSLSPYTQWLPSLFSSSSSVASPSSPSLAYPQASMFATLFFGSASAGNNPSHVEGMVFDRWWCEA